MEDDPLEDSGKGHQQNALGLDGRLPPSELENFFKDEPKPKDPLKMAWGTPESVAPYIR